MPEVDLLWRTSAEQRSSNFLRWQAAYAEPHSPAPLAEVDRRVLWKAITEYGRRRRRHGTAEPPTT